MTCRLDRPSRTGRNLPPAPGWLPRVRVFLFLGCWLGVTLGAVTFVDRNLETQVRAAIPGNPTGELTASELAAVTTLDAYAASVTQLDGLEYMTGLTSANLGANKNISDLAPLAGLTALEELRLEDNAINDLAPLASLTNLRVLRLYDNLITDLSPLKGLVRLEELWLMGNQVSDISTSKYFPDLTTYYLYGNQDWKRLDWLGFFHDGEAADYDAYGPHWIYHAQHGWLYWYLADNPYDFTRFWMWSSELGWCWMAESTYPYLWSAGRGAWLWYLEGSSSPRWFYNFGTAAWEQL